MDNENILNVINRSSWTYFNSDKISTIVYDVEIPETLYEELLPHSFDNRNINENEVACIEYRKSMLSSDQDQFLISNFDRNDFTLKQQKEIQLNEELKSQIRDICDVYEKKQSYQDLNQEISSISNNTSVLSKEEQDYIYSEEFIDKFGDWEKALRLEKLKQDKPLFIDERILLHGNDITNEINFLRLNNDIKSLSKIIEDISKEMIQNLRFEQNLTIGESPILSVTDGNRNYNINISMLKDVAHHNLCQKGHIEGIYNIPIIVKNALYIGKENNEDKRNPELKQFYYFAKGIIIENYDYTAKIVFVENNKGDFYYDQSLSTIEKGRFVDLIKKSPEVLNQINRSEYKGQSDGYPSEYYDKRLFRVCQVPQMPYLDNNLIPKKETIDAVKQGLLYIKKSEQQYLMIDSRFGNNFENALFRDFQFDFSRPVTWHFVDNTSLIYADTFISNEQALSLFNAAGANDSYNKDMQYCIQYRCTSTDKNNLVYLCKYDPNVEITTPLKEINLPEDIINKVMNGVETGINEHLQQQHTIPDYLLDAVGYGDKKVVKEEVSDYSTDSNKPEGIMYLSENHNVFYAKPDLPREEYLKLSAQTDIDELKKQQSFLYTDENDDFGYQSNILEQREVYQHKIDRLQAKIDSLNGVPNPLNEIISSQLPASMTSLHSFTEEERMGQFIGMKNDFKNYATEEEIKLLDDKFKTLFVDPESSVEIKKGEEFHLLADEFESYFQDTKNKHYNVASNQYESYADVQFESDKRSVEQEVVPDFAMITQNGLKKFSGFTIQAYSDKNDIYTLSNGSETIELPGDTIKELNKPNNNEINFHGEVYSHILDQQYNDFFKYREPNTAAYFEHNLSVMIRTQAQNPLDTFKAAKEIIKAMPKTEQKKTQELVKRIAASQNKSVNDLMLDIYNKAILERPMNEEFININNPRNFIPRHMTDIVYIPGQKIDDNSELKIGESINKVPVKAFKLNGKKQTIYLNLEVVFASKDKNLIVMKDSKENIYELPRDKILSQYEKNSLYNRRNQSVSVKQYNDSSMER